MPIDNVLDITPRVQYVSSASQTAFDYPFPIFADADLVVIVDGVTKTLTTHYIVSGEGDDTGGTVTFLSGQTSGAIVTIYRDIAIQRTSDFQTNGPLSSDTFNDELDRITLVEQQLESALARTVHLAIDDEGAPESQVLPSKADRASKFLAFDANGNPIASSAVSDGDALLRAELIAGASSLVKSTAIEYPITLAETTWLVTPNQYPFAASPNGMTNVLRYMDSAQLADFIAGTHSVDMTSAFDAAITTRKPVWAPAGNYVVSDIDVITGMTVVGEGKRFTTLWVGANNTAAFYHSAATDLYDITLKGFAIRANTGITGAKGYRQNDKSVYTSWLYAEDIETYADLSMAFDGWFIYSEWNQCRDGWQGGPPVGQQHQFIYCVPASAGQAKWSNLNTVRACAIVGATSGVSGAIHIQQGAKWNFVERTSFEQLSTRAIYAEGVYCGNIDDCWFEQITHDEQIKLLDATTGGCASWRVNSSWSDLGLNTVRFAAVTGAASLAVTNNVFANVPAGINLISSAVYLFEQHNNKAASGAGAAAFFNGYPAIRSNMTISSSEFTSSITNSPQSQNQNVLPIGPGGLGQANFTRSGYTAAADVASGIGLAGNAIQLTLDSGNPNFAYYTMPTKLVKFLQGRTVTFAISGYKGTTTVNDELFACIWDNVSPTNANATASTAGIDVSNADLHVSYVTATIGASSTAIYLGFKQGGQAGNVIVETAALFLGTLKPSIMSIR